MADFRLDPATLRHAVLAALDLLDQHLANLDQTPVKPKLVPGELAAKMAGMVPDNGSDISTLIAAVRTNFLPAITHWQHRRFFAYYPAATSIPAIVSELLIAALGSVGLQWSANPAATELECVVMDWILDLLGAPNDSPFRHTSRQGGGIIQNTAGEALAVIMTAARVNHHARGLGAAGSLTPAQLEDLYWQDSSSLVVYMSDQSHFSGPKAVRVAGMRLHKIPAKLLPNGNWGITADDVRLAMAEDRKKGLKPCALQLNYGSTNTCGYDDLESFKGFADQEQIWVHVDAAYAGPSLILPEFRERSHALQDIATSFNFNGSKWFLCGFDSAFLYVRDRHLLKQVFAADGAYLARVDEEQIYNPELKDWSIPLGRRFRALRIWMVLSYFGRSGLEAFLRKAIHQGNRARQAIDVSDVFEQVVKTDLGLVCFRLETNDDNLNDRWIKRIEELSDGGKHFLMYPSILEGRPILRLALGGVHTEDQDVDAMLQICRQAATDVGFKKQV
ncbi:MAG: hypothetical protein FJ146_08140 [Deltaproteobacteria bacterium]|nr:hypothetical protein [Deltaproteobacteria bacterium]